MVDDRTFTAGLARFFGTPPGVMVGIGDDAAVVRNRRRESVVCCDPVVAGVHFDAAAPLAFSSHAPRVAVVSARLGTPTP